MLADTLALAWQPASTDHVPASHDKAMGLAGLISEHWDRLGQPCPVAVRDQALRYAELLADAPPESLVVVHGDAHPGNALAVPHPGRVPRPATASSTRTASWPTARTTSE